MILPIVGYGHHSLRNENQDVPKDYPELEQLVENMFETMYNANGVGLAAPQVNLNLRLFVVDGSPMDGFVEGEEGLSDFKRVFINPEILEEEGKEWAFEEGCLSIPDIREDVFRKPVIKIRYYDVAFKEIVETLDGIKARIVQHEYDHIEGVLFTDHISQLRRRMLKPRLSKITKGVISADYKMKFAK
ncbi:MAG: peptide deformylase [Bacteroidota bacterium]